MQEPTVGRCLEPDESSPCLRPVCLRYVQIIFFHLRPGLPGVSFPFNLRMHAFLIYPMSVTHLARGAVSLLMQQASLDYNTIQQTTAVLLMDLN